MVRRKQQVESVQKRHPDLKDGEEKKPRKPTRFHPGTVALRDIRRAQKNTTKSFRKASFRRVVREVLHNIDDKRFADFRITQNAYNALQETAESFLTGLFRGQPVSAQRQAHQDHRRRLPAGARPDLLQGPRPTHERKVALQLWRPHLQLPSPCRLYSYQKRTISINMFFLAKRLPSNVGCKQAFLVSAKSRCKQINGSGVVGRLSRWSDHNPSHHE